MEWELVYMLQISKRSTFQELATKAHDMEVTMAIHYGNYFYSTESKKDKAKFMKNI